MVKKIIFLFTTVLICLLILNIFSSFLVDKILSFQYSAEKYHELSSNQGYTKEIIDFYDFHYKELHHLRQIQYHPIDVPENLIFRKIGNDQGLSILIQGDSWAEQYYKKKTKEKLEAYSKKMKYQFIHAGASSYSPSLMASQLNKIRRDFDLDPDYIIAVIDQTDIGDELCRYRDLREARDGEIIVKPEPINSFGGFQMRLLIDKYKNLYSNRYALIKMIHYLNFRIKSIVYDLDKEKINCDHNDILGILETGISVEDENYIIEIISDYIKIVFKDSKLKKLIIVTHPHENHLNGIYTLNIEDLINKAVDSVNFGNKITTISFTEALSTFSDLEISGVFKDGDKYSHLNNGYFLDFVLPKVIKSINPN